MTELLPSGLFFGSQKTVPLTIIAVFILAEFLWHRQRGSDGYDLKETAVSAVIMGGQLLSRALTALILTPVLAWVYSHRLFDIPLHGPLAIVGLFLGTEFFYYWFHRGSHQLRWLWATHGVHHSSTRLNFSAAVRLGWTNALSGGWLFFLPLVWMGYSPLAVFGALSVNLMFQFFLHTEAVGRLGFLEWLFNTPSHHRVHHAADEPLLDKNFGGVLILFDRCFGTFAPEPGARGLRYGLNGGEPGYNPVVIAFGEWRSLFSDMRRSGNPVRALRIAFGRP